MANVDAVKAIAVAFALALVGATTVVAGAADVRIVPLEPKPGDRVATATPNIAFELRGMGDVRVARDAVHVSLDGRDVGDRLRTVGTELVLVADAPLAAGRHQVAVRVDDPDGGTLSYAWPFDVAPDDRLPVNVDEFAAAPVGTLAPIGSGPYYWGDSVPFVYSGWPGALGYVTIPGLIGTYPLTPLFGNFFTAFVPIPYGFAFVNPIVICHVVNAPPHGFSGGKPTVPWHFPHLLTLKGDVHVVAERRPAAQAALPTRRELIVAFRAGRGAQHPVPDAVPLPAGGARSLEPATVPYEPETYRLIDVPHGAYVPRSSAVPAASVPSTRVPETPHFAAVPVQPFVGAPAAPHLAAPPAPAPRPITISAPASRSVH